MSAPILITTWPFGLAANEAAWPALDAGGHGLDAVCEVCHHVELDMEVDSVGLGGLPDSSGQMSLDACVMQAPGLVGAVCAYSHSPHPTQAARLVMEQSPHVLLAGAGADSFAREQGLGQRSPLADSARARFEAWRSRGGGPGESHDTVASLALDRHGRLAGACSTSGSAWKLAGRVGDSPIPGQGLYVDPEAGAAAATGLGELAMGSSVSFLAVEAMRRGEPPAVALELALERVRAAHPLDAAEQLAMVALAPDGRWGHATLRAGYETAVRASTGAELRAPEPLLSED